MAPEEKAATAISASKKKSSWLKRILVILLLIFAAMQFIQPDKNNQSMDMSNDITTVVTVPTEVQTLLKTACYDCHSNFTNYPWYSNIQPVGWWLKDHIDEGKQHLNFQEFASLKPRPDGKYKTTAALQDHKLEEVASTIEKGEMPLSSYTIIHTEAKLSEPQKKIITNWVDSARVQLATIK
jgi:hypothetical protein